ncbi:DUF2267 domain-containing protein [Aquabacter spiritensis]|uniref:Uncharacterized protein (DUF2267 family) n=1 Tax=Aquabacter spiritensis TaxID=933073 RepID=A0A4R3M6B0_9HYPH|nr:DUF2267 domain-containing protein [Aquabacter spiritensis]TCT06795.1 uncharacterized protein (DUF2267 family) [Aquabacter spiritensis]
MPIPLELQHASEDFERFLADARDTSGLATRNQTYTMVEGVLHTFRRRLTPAEAIDFAQVLPPVLRAIFVADWDITSAPVPFCDRAGLTREVKGLRRHHNFAPETCIADVSAALRRATDGAALDAVLDRVGPAAAEFWRVPSGG